MAFSLLIQYLNQLAIFILRGTLWRHSQALKTNYI